MGKVEDIHYVSHSPSPHYLYRCIIREQFSGERDLSSFLFFSYHKRFSLRLWGYCLNYFMKGMSGEAWGWWCCADFEQ